MKLYNLPQNVHIRLWGSFLNRCVSSAIIPFVVIYLSSQINKSFAGLFLAGIVILNFISNLIGGYLCDRLPRKKLLIVTSYLECLFLLVLWYSVINSEIIIFMFSYSLFSILSALRRPPLAALIQDAITPEIKHVVYRLDYWLINLSIAIGTTLGGILYSNHKNMLFAALFLSSFILTIVYQMYIIDKATIEKKKHKRMILDVFFLYKDVIEDKKYVTLIFGIMLLASVELTHLSYVSVRLSEEFNSLSLNNIVIDGVRMFAFLSLMNTLLIVILSLPIGKYFEGLKVIFSLKVGLMFYSIGYIFLMFSNNFVILIIFTFVAAIGEMIYAPIKNAEKLSLIPPGKRGSYQAFSTLGLTGADLISKIILMISVILNPCIIALIISIILLIGSIFTLKSLVKN